jgi:acylphosphatase
VADPVLLIAHVSGRVQGVGFRDWVRRRARPLDLLGSAVNLPDGRVEIRAEGSRSACDQLLDALYSGRAPGRVTDIDVSWSAATGQAREFRVG